MSQYDAIVIGAGHNGLTHAAFLARSGKKVLVLEKAKTVGGLSRKEEFHSGFYSTGLHNDSSCVSQEIADALNLSKHGLKFQNDPHSVYIADPDGPGIHLFKDAEKCASEISKYSQKDADSYVVYKNFLGRIQKVIRSLMNNPPPRVLSAKFENAMKVVQTALSLRMLGTSDMTELLRITPMCTADFMNTYFETDVLKAGIVGPAHYASYTAPWSPLTTLSLLLWESLSDKSIIGGGPALIQALTSAAKEYGATIRTEAAVKSLIMENNKTIGVRLENGEEIKASLVSSSCDPKTTFQKFVDPIYLTAQLDHRIQHFRARGTMAQLTLAIKGNLEFKNRPGETFEYVRTGVSLDQFEKSFDAIKYRQFSEIPTLEIWVPSVSDPSLAPEGHHVVSVNIHFAPYNLEGGWTEAQKQTLTQNTLKTLEQYTPNIRQQIVAQKILTPLDIETQYNVSNGHIFHGELAIDQMFTRPSPETGHYSTPIEGLYLCGSGSHPGGGLSCRPGALASKAVLQ